MGRWIRVLLAATAMYIALVLLLSAGSFVVPQPVPASLGITLIALILLAAPTATILITLWIVKRAGEHNVVIPLSAYWLGTTIGTALVWPFASRQGSSVLTGLVHPLTFGLLHVARTGEAAVVVLAGTGYAIGFPWAPVLIVGVTVLWRRFKRAGEVARQA